MRHLSDTIERLAQLRRMAPQARVVSRLTELVSTASNPGALLGWYRLPDDQKAAPPLVVVLHGCTQTASGYDLASGWSQLADDYGFAVLFPEQSRQNNANLCFNWFNDNDVTRGGGEVRSIRDMIGTMISDHGVDPTRIFVTGLSAGGAMASALLATYPEVFAGGAIIAGLPHGVASTVPEAFDRMRGHALPSPVALRAKLRAASSHGGPWPHISIWHGTADRTVADANALAIVEQWRGVHDVDEKPAMTDFVEGQEHCAWKDASGRDVIELYRIANMGHGTPIDPARGYGQSAAYMLDVGISSSEVIARGWGLTPSFERRTMPVDEKPHSTGPIALPTASATGIQDIIEGALRSAGLMK